MEYQYPGNKSSSTKFFNVCSYILNIVLLAFVLIHFLTAHKSSEPTNDDVDIKARISEVILEKERAELPLRAQELGVSTMTIDSIVFTGEEEGYLVCTVENKSFNYGLEFENNTKPLYVKVNIDANKKGVRWYTDWRKAALENLLDH